MHHQTSLNAAKTSQPSALQKPDDSPKPPLRITLTLKGESSSDMTGQLAYLGRQTTTTRPTHMVKVQTTYHPQLIMGRRALCRLIPTMGLRDRSRVPEEAVGKEVVIRVITSTRTTLQRNRRTLRVHLLLQQRKMTFLGRLMSDRLLCLRLFTSIHSFMIEMSNIDMIVPPLIVIFQSSYLMHYAHYSYVPSRAHPYRS